MLRIRHGLVSICLVALLSVVACSNDEAAPEPTPSKTSPPTYTIIYVTPTSTTTPTATSTPPPKPAPPNPTSRAPGAPAPKPVVKDPLLPIFGAFPPVPIPVRPANINPLTGLEANPAALQRRPILVRIGNDEVVRTSQWQAGLSSADIVFEELIDQLGSSYANTRYTAVFLSQDPQLVGPIRSGRIINFQLAPMLDGALAHAGASDGTRWLFSQSPMTNLDEYFNQGAYCYVKSHGYQGRLFSTGARLREWLVKKGWEKPVPLYGFNFSPGAPAGQPVTTIGITKSPWPKYDQLQWQYDPGKGIYMRSVTGAALVDHSYPVTAKWGSGADCVPGTPDTKTLVSATNVVVLYAKHEKTNIVEDSANSVSVHIYLTGQGDAQFFRDGIMVKGKWQRQSEQEFFRLTDAAGNPFALKPGTTWFEIVPTGYPLDAK
jgi:hypothetical protein